MNGSPGARWIRRNLVPIGTLTALVVTIFAIFGVASLTAGHVGAPAQRPAPVVVSPAPAAYPPALEQTFVRGCDSTAPSDSYCQCVLSWIESNVPVAEFEMDAENFDPNNPPAWFLPAETACVGS